MVNLSASADNYGCPAVLEPVSCVSHIKEELVLDGQVMNCPEGIRVYTGLILQGGSRIESGDIDVVDGGYISARGTENCPISLTSASPTPAPGDWQFHIHPGENAETSLTWTIIEYAGEANREAIETTASDGSIAFDHVSIRNVMGRTALDLRGGKVSKFSNVSFHDVAGSAMEISPNQSGIVDPSIAIDDSTVDGPWVHVRGNRLDQDTEWENIGVPYLVEDFSVRATLSISEGATVLYDRKADLRVENDGRLIVSGTASAPVIFDTVSKDPQPGDWNRVVIASKEENEFSHMQINHGGGNNRQGAITVTKSGAVTVRHTRFANNLTCDIKNNGALTTEHVEYIECP